MILIEEGTSNIMSYDFDEKKWRLKFFDWQKSFEFRSRFPAMLPKMDRGEKEQSAALAPPRHVHALSGQNSTSNRGHPHEGHPSNRPMPSGYNLTSQPANRPEKDKKEGHKKPPKLQAYDRWHHGAPYDRTLVIERLDQNEYL